MPNLAPSLFSLQSYMSLLLISLKSREMASPSVSFVSWLQLFSASAVTGEECSSLTAIFAVLSCLSCLLPLMLYYLTSCPNRPVAVIERIKQYYCVCICKDNKMKPIGVAIAACNFMLCCCAMFIAQCV